MSDSDDRPQYDVVLLVVYSVVGLIAPVFIGMVYEDWLTGSVLVFLCIASYMGYRMGLLKMLAFLATCYTVYLFAWPMGQALDPHIQNQFEISALMGRGIGVGMSAVSIFLLAAIMGHILVRKIYDLSERLELIDRIFGFLVGVAEGGFIAALMLGAAVSVAPLCQQRIDLPETTEEGPLVLGVSHGVVHLAAATNQSLLSSYFQDNNPVNDLPVVNQVENATVVFNDSGATQELLEHPNIVALIDQPAMKKTIDLINADPELQAFFQSGQVNHISLMQLAEHPAFMKIVDEADLMTEIISMFRQIQPALEEVGSRHR